MSKSRSFLSILIPSATVFFSSGCIMVLELVAGRLIARHLGSSLYTWTSVIGVVLLGITIGNYLGGRIADRFPARKALAVLFAISSVACVAVVLLNNLVGGWIWLWKLSWPMQVFSHVFLVFFIPSTLLGTISPVVAKMALDKGLPTGRTVGDIYAFGAAGSIVGTFLTGFYLIATMGTIAIIWAVGAALLLMAILYWAKLWVLYLWAAIFIALMAMGTAPADWAKETGANLALREKPNPDVIYTDESQYCYIAVKRISETVDKRAFMQDKLKHSEVIMGDINDLQYFYTHIYAAITRGLSRDKDRLSVMVIGGGGYVYPRYIEKNWPGSRVDVAEIDPGVTEAAMQAFGLERDTSINTFTMDARNYVDELLERKHKGEKIPKYDFIYEDAINDYSVPYQLVTKEFNDKIAQLLKDDGLYMVNLIDVFDNGQFLGAIINTLQQTFPNVNVLSEITPRNMRNTFVVVAAKQEINPEKLLGQYKTDVDIWYLDDAEINTLKQKSHYIVLTDDYAPVENMLAPVVRQSAVDLLSGKYQELAEKLKQEGKLEESIAICKEILEVNPRTSITAYTEIGTIRVQQGRLREAAEAFRRAIKYNEQAEIKINVASAHLDLAFLLKQLKQPEKSREHFRKAIEGLRKELTKNPKSQDTIFRLGVALSEVGEFSEATKYLQQTVDMDPFDVKNHLMLAQALLIQERYDEATERLGEAVRFMLEHGRKDDATELQSFLEMVKLRKSKHKK